MELIVKKAINKIRREVGKRTTVKFKYALDAIEKSASEDNISRLVDQLINAFDKSCPKDMNHVQHLLYIKEVIDSYREKDNE